MTRFEQNLRIPRAHCPPRPSARRAGAEMVNHRGEEFKALSSSASARA